MAGQSLKTVEIGLTQDEVRYILHALKEFMAQCHEKVDDDPDGEGDLTHMYAEDILHARSVHDRIKELSMPVFGDEGLVVSYEIL